MSRVVVGWGCERCGLCGGAVSLVVLCKGCVLWWFYCGVLRCGVVSCVVMCWGTRKWTTTSRGAWKRQKKTGYENRVVRLKKRGRTTVKGHTNSWKIWPLWNKGKLLLSKIAQENASQKNDRYCTDGQNTALSCTTTSPMEIHQYWTVPRQTQRMTTPSFAEKWRLQYNH